MTEPVRAVPPRTPFVLPPQRAQNTLADRLRGAAIGAVAGMLAGYFLSDFGLKDILGTTTHVLLATALLIGAILGALKLHWLIIAADGALFLTYLVIAGTPLMFRVAGQWVRADPIPASADAIVVLSGGINSDGSLNTQGVQRLLSGLELYQRGVASRLFTTSVQQEFPNGVLSSTADQERLIRLGGAASAWTSLSGVFTTRDEALQSAVKLPVGARTVIVVTSPMHTRRACATFEAVGFKVICRPSREQEFVTWHPLSVSHRLASFRDYAYERLGMVKYRSKGWIR